MPQGASLAVPRRLRATPAAPRSSNQRIGRHRGCSDNPARHGHRCLAPEPARRPELAPLERPRAESGGRAQPLHPTPSTMCREFDRRHLPRWRPEPPFSRVGPPNPRPQAPGAAYPSSNSPKREPSKEKYKEPLRRWHQDLEPHAAGTPAPARGLRAAARRLHRPPTDPSHRRRGTTTVRCVARSFAREGVRRRRSPASRHPRGAVRSPVGWTVIDGPGPRRAGRCRGRACS